MNDLQDIRDEVLAFMSEREARPGHVRHVAALALQLFDGLAALHGLGPREKLLLETAALLHDIGHRAAPSALSAPSEGHHKESARLIREQAWRHFSLQEVEVIAQTARYHRKSMPELSHDEFRALQEWDRRLVQRLAALLRLADALDRSHQQLIQLVQVEVLPNQLVFHLDTTAPVPKEVQSADLKGDLAQAVFQRDLVFMVRQAEAGPAGGLPA